jgi:hypothetical protein
MCMYDDSEPATVFREDQRRAAKQHRCGECQRTIERGEEYLLSAGLWGGHWATFKTCGQCREVTKWLIGACGGFMYEMAAEDLAEHVTGEEAYVRSAALVRLMRWMTAGWRDRRGEMISVDRVVEVRRRADDAFANLVAQGFIP